MEYCSLLYESAEPRGDGTKKPPKRKRERL
jgi:hypothetical protein